MTSTEQSSSRTVLITGSTSGIGAATAAALAAEGWHVVITGRDTARVEAVVSGIEEHGGRAVFVPSDLTAATDAVRAFASIATRAVGGQLDAVVHNAVLCPPIDTITLTDGDLGATLAVNIRAPHVLTAALAPAMLERGHGAIVVIGSWMAPVGHPSSACTPRRRQPGAVGPELAAEFGPRGIRVNSVSPGATRTPINAGDGDVLDRMTAAIPAGRPGTPDEIAATVTWLLSDRAAYLHGAEIPVDGGITATRPA